MPDELVRWNDLLYYFTETHPQTVAHVVEHQVTAKVIYLGNVFEIRPMPGPFLEHIADSYGVDIYGPAFLHPVPNPIVTL